MGLRTFVAATGALALLALPSAALAAPGQPDLTFGFDGFRTIDFGGEDFANAVALQPDGKIVLAGSSTIAGEQSIALARLTSAGAPDTSFSGDGRFTYDVAPGAGQFATAVAAQPDGRVVFVGTTGTGDSLADTGRLRADGTFDPMYDVDGHRGFNWGVTDVATAIAVRPNGKLVIAGHTTSGENIVVQQVNSDGAPDDAFGENDGFRTIDRGGTERAGGLALQSDGKVIVTGWTTSPAGTDLIVTRLTTSGAPDPSFAGTGTVVVNLGGAEFGNAVAVAPDGNIVVAGTSRAGANDQNFVLVRLNPDGSFDGSFDGDGRAVFDPTGAVNDARAVAVQPDGKVVFAGTVYANDTLVGEFAEVERVTPSGAWDPTFHTDGHTGFHYVPGAEDTGQALALQPDGMIVVAGSTTINQDFAVARLEGGPFPAPPPPPPPPPPPVTDADGDGIPDASDRCASVPRGRFDTNGDGCPGPYARIDFGLRGGWNVLRAGIRMSSETVTRVPVGATVVLRCRSCRIRQTFRARSSNVRLRRLRGKLLRRGASFSVRVTAPGRIGQVKTLTVKQYGRSRSARRRIAPDPFKTVRRCIPIGSTRPARSCSATPPTGP